MTTYDSDSSYEGDDYTTTNVILGYAASEVNSGDEISHIGGFPIWLDENAPPALSFSKCKSCKGYLSLLLQLNADLRQHFPNDTRRIFVLSCKNRSCSRKPGSIRAFREVRKPGVTKKKQAAAKSQTAAPQQPTQQEGLGNLLFGGGSLSSSSNANPFATSTSKVAPTTPSAEHASVTDASPTPDAESSTETQPLTTTFAEKLKLGSPDSTSASTAVGESERWPRQSVFPAPFPHFYLDAYPEELDPTPVSQPTNASTSQVQYDTEDAGGTVGESDAFESSLDKTFQKFSDLVAQNPEQVLRYEFKGEPLLYSGADAPSTHFILPHGKSGAVKGIPRCEQCGAQRAFELQLMPYLIFVIEKDDPVEIDEGIEWGTVIVGTCTNNCGIDGAISYRDEWVGIQWEERVAKR